MTKFNPFSEVYEPNTKYKHARTLRNSFWQKIAATYYVFAGKSAKKLDNGTIVRERQVGIYDYLTFGITDMLGGMFSGAFATVMMALFFSIIGIPLIPVVALAFAVAGLVFVALEGVRLVAAAALTVVASPFVALVSLVSAIASFRDKKNVKNIELNVDRSPESIVSPDSDNQNTTSLSNFLGKKSNFDDVEISLSGTTAALRAVFTTRKDAVVSTRETTFNLYSKDGDVKTISNPEHHKAFKSLRALNVGNGNLYRQWQAVKAGEQDPQIFQSNKAVRASR